MLYLLFLIPPLLFGDTSILKETKRELLQKKRDEVEAQGEAIKNSWWGGINLEASYNWTDSLGHRDNYPQFTATISQDIFRSGGIFNQIDSGKLYKILNKTLLDKEERELLFSIYSTVLNIQKLDIQIKQQRLLIENQKIIIKNQKESYLNGVSDISELDKSIIELNTLKNRKEELLQAKIDLIATLKNLTDLNYKDIRVPKFPKISLDEFLKRSSNLAIQRNSIEKLELDKKLIYSKYLPRVSIYGSYQYEDSDRFRNNHSSTAYGIKISMPISFSMGDAFENAKVSYLRSKSELRDLVEKEKLIYSKVISKLESIDRRVRNSQELVKSYQNIYKITKEYYNNNLKSADDVTVFKNRVEISKLDLEMSKIDRELVKLTLYREILEK